MGRSRNRIYEEHYPYFITLSIVDEISLFADPLLSDLILDSLSFMQKNRIKIHAYVVMHNHMHVIVKGGELTSHIRKFKSYTARSIIDSLKDRGRKRLLDKLHHSKHNHHKDSEYQVWQEGFHPKQISSHEMMIQKNSQKLYCFLLGHIMSLL